MLRVGHDWGSSGKPLPSCVCAHKHKELLFSWEQGWEEDVLPCSLPSLQQGTQTAEPAVTIAAVVLL